MLRQLTLYVYWDTYTYKRRRAGVPCAQGLVFERQEVSLFVSLGGVPGP